jgi:hypothetical protein
MEAVCSSKTMMNFYWTTWHYIPGHDNIHINKEFHDNRRERLSFENFFLCSLNVIKCA